MPIEENIVIAAKCAPEEKVLSSVKQAGLKAVELFLSRDLLSNVSHLIRVCRNYSLRYVVHASNDGYALEELQELVKGISAEIVVFHNIYWEDEWGYIVESFRDSNTRLCIENTYSVHEPAKFVRRFGLGRCLDLEHLQMECAGVYEDVFISFIKETIHIHMTGYRYGTGLWHTHIHHSPEHSLYLLNLLRKSGYSGLVVSEAKNLLQSYEEFKKLNDFYKAWKNQ